MEELKRANAKMADDKQKLEELLNMGGSDGELQLALQKMESELQDVLTQQQLFEEEKEEEIRVEQQHSAEMAAKLAEQDVQMEGYRRQLADLQNERDTLMEMMAEEGAEMRSRIGKLEKDKESLHLALATPSELPGAAAKLRTLVDEHEALKDLVVQKEGELLRLQGHMDGATKRLELADIEISMLKNELEALKSDTGVALQSPSRAMAAPGACKKVSPATPPTQNRAGARPTAKLATPPRTSGPSGSRGVCSGTSLSVKDQGACHTSASGTPLGRARQSIPLIKGVVGGS